MDQLKRPPSPLACEWMQAAGHTCTAVSLSRPLQTHTCEGSASRNPALVLQHVNLEATYRLEPRWRRLVLLREVVRVPLSTHTHAHTFKRECQGVSKRSKAGFVFVCVCV